MIGQGLEPSLALVALRASGATQTAIDLVEVAVEVAELLEQADWDQPVQLAVLRRVDGSEGIEILSLPLPSQLLELGPARAVGILASLVPSGLADALPAGVLGWILVTEGWALESTADLGEEEIQAVAEHHLVSEHPLRIETRLVSLVDRDGRFTQIITPRDGDPEMAISGCSPAGVELSGRVPDALRALMLVTP